MNLSGVATCVCVCVVQASLKYYEAEVYKQRAAQDRRLRTGAAQVGVFFFFSSGRPASCQHRVPCPLRTPVGSWPF